MNSILRSTAHPIRSARGFTLIEVLIVMAVVAILALMALPLFSGRAARSQIVDSLQLADLAMKAVANYYGPNTAWAWPADNATANLPEAKKIIGSYVTSVEVKAGAINMTFGNNAHSRIAGKKLSIRPAVVPDTKVVPIAWLCGNKPVPKGMEAGGVNATDIPPDTLPLDCR